MSVLPLDPAEPFLALSAGELTLLGRAADGGPPGPWHFLAVFRGPCLVPLHRTADVTRLGIRAGEGARFARLPRVAGFDHPGAAAGALAAAGQFFSGLDPALPALPLLSVFPGERIGAPRPAGVFAAAEPVLLESVPAGGFDVLGGGAASGPARWLYLPQRAWALLGPAEAGELTLHTPAATETGAVLEGTGELLGQLIQISLNRTAGKEEREHGDVGTRHAAAAEALRSGLDSLRSVLEFNPPPEVPAAGPDALSAQMEFLWQRQGIRARPAGSGGKGRMLERARVFAEAAGVRSRTVALRGAWWRDDCGPLLAATEPGDEPVALWRERGRYRLRGADGRIRGFDAAVAPTLDGFALSFYRALPDGKVSALGLVRHAFFGRGRALAQAVGLSLVLAALALLTPVITSQLIDFAIPSAESGQILLLTGGLALAAIVGALFQYAQSVLILATEGQVNQEMECAVWDRLLRLPVEFFKRYTLGDLEQRAASINRLRATLSGKAVSGALSGLFAAANFTVLFAFSPAAAGAALLLAVPLAALLGAFTVLSTRWQRVVLEGEADLSSVTFELLSAVPKLRATASEPFALRRWAGAYGAVRRKAFHLQLLESSMEAIVGFYGHLAQAVLYSIIGYTLLSAAGGGGEMMSSGQFVGFMAAFGAFLLGMNGIARSIAELNEIKPLYDRVLPLLQTEAEGAGRAGAVPELRGAVDIVALTFGYTPDAPVLRDINLSIRPGEFVALVGASGSGKSTLLRLLLGFERPDAGEIRYEGASLEDLDLRALRRRFGVVLQHGMLVPSDIISNIRGVTDASLEECWAAAAAVALDAEIRAMPMGMMTMISEGSSTISGGQRQRILLARAIVKQPRIVFLDEATSALDNISQAVVTESLERLAATRVVIAHRLSTIRQADRIIVLEDGRIVEEGRYDDLIARRGSFHRLAERQTLDS
jgi:ATP-binding cassette subfamily C protein